MKLTSNLILESASLINPLKDRELVLRDLKIPAIENLGVSNNLNDTIDFSNNDLRTLGGFPRMNRLEHLLLANNRIEHIDDNIAVYLPNLTTVILTNNALYDLENVEPLFKCSNLAYLSLLDNPIQKNENYRLYMIHKIPSLRMLDFKKVKQKEREEAAKLFKNAKNAKKSEAS